MPVTRSSNSQSSSRPRRWPAVLVAGLACAACIASGCGGVDATSLCAAQEACRGGNADDTKACADEIQVTEKLAGDIGCSSEYKTFFTCVAAASTCHTQTIGACVAGSCGQFPGATCNGQNCTVGSYGVPASMGATAPCEAETAAWDSCSGMGQAVGGGP